MSKSIVKFELNKDGVAELMKSAEMKDVLTGYASDKANSAGAGYSYEVKEGKKRAYANIFPADAESAKDNYENNTLLKVIGT